MILILIIILILIEVGGDGVSFLFPVPAWHSDPSSSCTGSPSEAGFGWWGAPRRLVLSCECSLHLSLINTRGQWRARWETPPRRSSSRLENTPLAPPPPPPPRRLAVFTLESESESNLCPFYKRREATTPYCTFPRSPTRLSGFRLSPLSSSRRRPDHPDVSLRVGSVRSPSSRFTSANRRIVSFTSPIGVETLRSTTKRLPLAFADFCLAPRCLPSNCLS